MSADLFTGMLFAAYLWFWVPKLIDAWKSGDSGALFTGVVVAIVAPLLIALGLY